MHLRFKKPPSKRLKLFDSKFDMLKLIAHYVLYENHQEFRRWCRSCVIFFAFLLKRLFLCSKNASAKMFCLINCKASVCVMSSVHTTVILDAMKQSHTNPKGKVDKISIHSHIQVQKFARNAIASFFLQLTVW